MRQKRKVEFFFLRYVPAIVEDRFLDIGVLMVESGGTNFVAARFLRDWNQVLKIDADADVEVLQAMAREIEREWLRSVDRVAILRKMEDSFSNSIQISPKMISITYDPAKELERLASTFL
jgi:Protein of unknown function (DUF3037)